MHDGKLNRTVADRGPLSSLTEQKEKGIFVSQGGVDHGGLKIYAEHFNEHLKFETMHTPCLFILIRSLFINPCTMFQIERIIILRIFSVMASWLPRSAPSSQMLFQLNRLF